MAISRWFRWPTRKPRTIRRRPLGSLERLEDRTVPSLDIWTNPGSGNWHDGGNWSTGVPTSADVVLIDTGAAATITIQSGDILQVKALTTGNNDTLMFAGGLLSVTAGASTLNGPLTATGPSELTANGVNGGGPTLTYNGGTTLSGVSLSAEYGATISLPGVTSYTGLFDYSTTLEAAGAGGVLSAPKLTSVTVDTTSAFSRTQIVALAGGTVDLPALPQIATGVVYLDSDGANSVLNVPVLTSFTGLLNNQGSISTLEALDGSTLNLPALTDIDALNLTAGSGASLTLPGVKSYTGLFNYTTELEATGAGSVLSLPNLTSLTVDTTSAFSRTEIVALAGGTVDLPSLPQIATGVVYLDSDDTNSVVNAPDLTSFTGLLNNQGSISTLEALDGSTLNLPALTDVDDLNLTASLGATLSLPGVKSYTGLNQFTTTLEAEYAGSVLSLPNLSSLTVDTTSAFSRTEIVALAGGSVDLPSLPKIATGVVYLDSDGVNSVVNVPVLTSFTGLLNNQGSISILEALDGSTLNLPALTDIDALDITAASGASLTLPAVKSYTGLFNYTTELEATGAGSVLSLPNLTSLTEDTTSAFSRILIEAVAGGTVSLPELTTIDGGNGILLNIDGPGSKLDISASTALSSSGGGASLQVTNSGTVLESKLISLNGIAVTLDGSDPTIGDSWSKFTNGRLTVTGGSYNLPNLIDATGSNIAIDSGAALSVPASTNGGTYTIALTGTLIVGSDDVTPLTVTVPSAFASNNWSGTFSGTAKDTSGTGLASVGVSFFNGSQYFDGTAFESPIPVYLPATLNGTNWTFTLPIIDFPPDVSCTVSSQAKDNGGGIESPTIAALVLTQLPPVVTSVHPAQGPTSGGTTVTIAGTYLSNAVAVDFGTNNPATIVSDTFGALVVTSPVGMVGTIDVTVTNAAGTSATSTADQFTYFASPIVTMTAPANGSATNNNKPTLSATASDNGGPGLASVQFEYMGNGDSTWSNAGSAENSGPFSFTFTTALPDGNYEARAVATDNAGNSATSSPVSFTIDTASLTITSAPNTSFTAGGNLSFQVMTTGSPAANSFSLSGAPAFLIINNAGLLTGTSTVAATYSFNIIASNGVSPNASQSFTLTVSPGAATHFSVTGSQTPTVGVATVYTVTALDAYNNTATAYPANDAVRLKPKPGSAVVSGGGALMLTNGVGVATVTFNRATTYRLVAHGPNPNAGRNISGALNDIVATQHFTVVRVVIDDNSGQRSMVRSLTVTLAGNVEVSASQFTLVVKNAANPTGGTIVLNGTPTFDGRNTVITLLFANDPATVGTSLADGRYSLLFQNQDLSDFFRLFGDATGSGTVTTADQTLFNAAYGSRRGQPKYNSIFDFDDNGFITGLDRGAFQANLGKSIDVNGIVS